MQQTQLETSVCALCPLLRYLRDFKVPGQVEVSLSVNGIDRYLLDEERGPAQMGEVIDWLRRGELRGYAITHATATRPTNRVEIARDCHSTPPTQPRSDTSLLAERLEQLLHSAVVEEFHVRVRLVGWTRLVHITVNEPLTVN